MIPGYLTGQVRDRPQIAAYQWRTRAYPHAVEAIARAQAEHGPPVPVCSECGGRLRVSNAGMWLARCAKCRETSAVEDALERAEAEPGPGALGEVIGLLAALMEAR